MSMLVMILLVVWRLCVEVVVVMSTVTLSSQLDQLDYLTLRVLHGQLDLLSRKVRNDVSWATRQ